MLARLKSTMVDHDEDTRIAHLLSRAAFGPTAGTVESMRGIGRAQWIEQQLHPEHVDDPELAARLASYPSLTLSTAELLVAYPDLPNGDRTRSPNRIPAELAAALFTRAVHAQAQLEEVLVDFWLNHFNVYAFEGPTRWTIIAYARDAIRPHVLGRFEDLVRATAESPAMLYYLDNYVNAREGASRRANGINENYARELMELHTLGVDGGYTQDDVIEVARAFTGWTITPRERYATIDFLFLPAWHDPGVKHVLGTRIASSGVEEGRQIIHMLACHPSTAQFIATKLVRRFVSDEPPAELVATVRDTFVQTDGDLRAVMRALLTSSSFSAAPHRNAKVKTPLEFVASALRAVDADVVVGFNGARLVAELGQRVLGSNPPTGWPETASAVLSAGGMLNRAATAYQITAGRIPGIVVDVAQWERLTGGRLGPDRIARHLLQKPASIATRSALRDARRSHAEPAVLAALVLASPEFQQQ